jgi:GNAT superfamily N-acetyltransferase
MQINKDGYIFSDDQALIDLDSVCALLKQAHWAKDRDRDTVEKTIKNSLCFGVYKDGVQIGYARAVTDYTTIYWLSEAIIDERYRGKGLGKALVGFIINSDKLKSLDGALSTIDAHTLYQRFGFKSYPNEILAREAKVDTDHK